MMQTVDWNEIAARFFEAVDLEGATREEYLSRLDGTDAAVATEVRTLLVGHARKDECVTKLEAAFERFERLLPECLIGETVGNRYRIIGFLGKGAAGHVFLGEHLHISEKKVALKFITIECAHVDLKTRFKEEATILATCEQGQKQPGIVRFIDVISDPGVPPVIVMEYVDGDTINEWNLKPARTDKERMSCITALVRAVGHAHDKGVVHCDLKPSNVRVADGCPRILDFGSSIRCLSVSSPIGMSIPYASPQQIRGEPPAPSDDVHALGVLLCELMLQNRLTDGIPAKQVDLLPTELRCIVKKCVAAEVATTAMEFGFEHRYRNANELHNDLQLLLARRAISAHPGGMLYRCACLFRRKWGTVVTSTTVVSLLILLVSYRNWGKRQDVALGNSLIDRVQETRMISELASEEALGTARTILEKVRGTISALDASQKRAYLDIVTNLELGELEFADGEFPIALEMLSSAYEHAAKQTLDDECDTTWLVLHCASGIALGDKMAHGDYPMSEVVSTYRSVETSLARLSEGLGNDEAQRLKACLLDRFGKLAGQEFEWEDALDRYRAAQGIRGSFNDDSKRTRVAIAISRFLVADCLMKLGRLDEAEEGFKAALAQIEPDCFRLSCQMARAVINERLGQLDLVYQRFDVADSRFAASEETWANLVEQNQYRHDFKFGQIPSLQFRGDVLSEQGFAQLQEARQARDNGLIAEAKAKLEKAVSLYHRAADLYEHAIKIVRALIKDEPQRTQFRLALWELLKRKTMVAKATGQREIQQGCVDELLELARGLKNSNASISDLYESARILGLSSVFVQTKDKSEAINLLNRALQIVSSLLDSKPTTREFLELEERLRKDLMDLQHMSN